MAAPSESKTASVVGAIMTEFGLKDNKSKDEDAAGGHFRDPLAGSPASLHVFVIHCMTLSDILRQSVPKGGRKCPNFDLPCWLLTIFRTIFRESTRCPRMYPTGL